MNAEQIYKIEMNYDLLGIESEIKTAGYFIDKNRKSVAVIIPKSKTVRIGEDNVLFLSGKEAESLSKELKQIMETFQIEC